MKKDEKQDEKQNVDLSQLKDDNLFKVDSVLKIQVSKGKYHTLRYPAKGDLKKLEIQFPERMTIDRGGDIETPSNTTARKLYLWNLLIEKVEGYPSDDLSKVPVAHKAPVANEVLRVGAVDEDYILDHFGKDYLYESDEYAVVYTTAYQAGKEFPMFFKFNQPTEQHVSRYESAVAYQQKRKKTKFSLTSKPRVDALCDLYQELVVDVYGYSTGDGMPIADCAQVPTLHQVVAVDTLFKGILEELGDQEKN